MAGVAEISHQVIDTIGKNEALDPTADQVQQALEAAYDAGGPVGQQIENALHGTLIGHPLHPILVEIPVGAWTAVQVLDAVEVLTGTRALAPGADAALAIGLVGALGAAASGMTDWKDIGGEARRIGLVHGALNMTAAALYATALVLRRKPESRPLGLALSLAGYSTVIASAILGGDMVYRHRIGTNHANDEALPEQFVAVLPAEELNEGELRRVEANGTPVMLARHEGEVYALAERCAHLGGPLAEGKLIDGSVQCPWHGSRFQLRDGKVLDGPSAFPQPCLAVRIRNGQIEVQSAERQAIQDTAHAVTEKGSDIARELGG